QTMHDARALDPADAREALPAMGEKRVDEGSVWIAGSRMDYEARGLVDDEQVLILVNHREREGLRRRASLDTLGDEYGESLTGLDLGRGLAHLLGAETHLARLDEALQARARELRQRLSKEDVEPRAAVLGPGRDFVFDLALWRGYVGHRGGIPWRDGSPLLGIFHARTQGFGHRHGHPHRGRDGARGHHLGQARDEPGDAAASQCGRGARSACAR